MADDRYEALIRAYVAEVRAVKLIAERWWRDLVAEAPGGAAEVQWRWPCGPTGHPRVIEVFRRYYFAFEALERELLDEVAREEAEGAVGWGEDDPEEERGVVSPHASLFLELERLDPELGEFMNLLLFSPLGAGADGVVL